MISNNGADPTQPFEHWNSNVRRLGSSVDEGGHWAMKALADFNR